MTRIIFFFSSLLVILFFHLATPTQAKLLKSLDFENGLSGLERTQITECASIDVSSEVAQSGKHSMRTAVDNCGERAEATIFIPKKEKEYWAGFSFYVKREDLKPGRKDYTLFHQNVSVGAAHADKTQDWTCGPARKITYGFTPDGKFSHRLYYPGSGNKMLCKSYSSSINFDAWNEMILHFKISTGRTGFMEGWLNGKQFMKYTGPLTRNSLRSPGLWKMGVYTGDPGNGSRVVYIDDVKVGDASSSYEEVSSLRRINSD